MTEREKQIIEWAQKEAWTDIKGFPNKIYNIVEPLFVNYRIDFKGVTTYYLKDSLKGLKKAIKNYGDHIREWGNPKNKELYENFVFIIQKEIDIRNKPQKKKKRKSINSKSPYDVGICTTASLSLLHSAGVNRKRTILKGRTL